MKLTAQIMHDAFAALDRRIDRPVRLIVGGGGAMLLAHGYLLATLDVDAVPASGLTIAELEPLVRAVAEELELRPDWLNPYYLTFTHVLPHDYGSRLIRVCTLKNLLVDALSQDDLLVMKCFAARQKDVVHARALVKRGARTAYVRDHIIFLQKKGISGTERAVRFLGEIEAFFSDGDDR